MWRFFFKTYKDKYPDNHSPIYYDAELLCDIGPFKAGQVFPHATIDLINQKLILGDDCTDKQYTFKILVTAV